jgi:hypothetical protein
VKVQYHRKAGSLKRNTALEYSTRVVQEGGRRCKKSTLNDLVHLTPLRIPFMNPPIVYCSNVEYEYYYQTYKNLLF